MNRYNVLLLAFSAAVIILSSVVILKSYGGIYDRLIYIRNSMELETNPKVLTSDNSALELKLNLANDRLKKFESLIAANLDSFVQLSNDYSLKLNEVNLAGKSNSDGLAPTAYSLIITGKIKSILDALDYMENNYLMSFERISLRANGDNSQDIDLDISILLYCNR